MATRWRRTVVLVIILLTAAGVEASDKSYTEGTLVNIRSSHDATFFQGTSEDEYFFTYVVRVGGHLYYGTCRDRLIAGCDIRFVIGTSVQVRFDKSKMYLLRSNGKEQKTYVYREEVAGQ